MKKAWIRSHFGSCKHWCFKPTVWCMRWKERQQRDRERQRWRVLEQSPVSTCTAGGKMSLLMDSSFLQHLEQPRPAKGIKYGIIIIILQFSIILLLSLSLFRSNARALISQRLKRARFIFPWNPRRIRGEQKTHEGTCRGKGTGSVITCARTHLPV